MSKPIDSRALLEKSKELLAMFTENKKSLGSTLAKDAKDYARSLSELGRMVEGLHNKSHNTLSVVMERFNLLDGATFDHALEQVSKALETTVEAAAKSDAFKTVQEKKIHAATIAKEIEAETKGPGAISHWVGKIFERHDKLFDGKSSEAKLGFAVAEMAVGSIATDIGGQLLKQAITGLRETSIQQEHQVDDGKKGSRTTTVVVMTPLSKSERVLKAVLGTGGVTAGIGGTILGFRSLFKM